MKDKKMGAKKFYLKSFAPIFLPLLSFSNFAAALRATTD